MDAVARRFRQDCRHLRCAQCVVCVGDAAVQYDDLHGRLTLNMLLSFAQFEREIAGERIRDKIAASKKKGM
ncbi:MAG: recombinase family protein [Methylocella sp.]